MTLRVQGRKHGRHPKHDRHPEHDRHPKHDHHPEHDRYPAQAGTQYSAPSMSIRNLAAYRIPARVRAAQAR